MVAQLEAGETDQCEVVNRDTAQLLTRRQVTGGEEIPDHNVVEVIEDLEMIGIDNHLTDLAGIHLGKIKN